MHWAWVVLGTSFVSLFITYSIRIGAYSVCTGLIRGREVSGNERD